MATLKELMQDVVNMSYDQRVGCARQCYNDAMKIIRTKVDLAPSVSPRDFMYMLLGTAIAKDGTFSVGEKRMIMDLGLDCDEMFTWAQATLDVGFESTVDSMIDSLNVHDKTILVLLCIYIMGADGTITVSEQNIINRFLA